MWGSTGRLLPAAASRSTRWLTAASCRRYKAALPDVAKDLLNGIPVAGVDDAPKMVTIHFLDPNQPGTPRQTIQAPVGATIVDVAKAHGVDIHAACGQQLQCATCHVILQQEIYSSLNPPGVRETDLLDMTYTLTPTSRLGCQVKLTEELDGIECLLPSASAKGSVRMRVDQPRRKITKSWTAVSASVSRDELQENGKPREDEELKDKLADQMALAARLERELQAARMGKTKPLPEANKADTGKKQVNENKDETEEGSLEKLKEELSSTLLDPSTLGRKATFDDVVGLEEAKRALLEALIWPASAHPSLFTGIRARSNGVLMYGPPGCGKTMLARAAAVELTGTASFFLIRPGDIMARFYGESQRRVQALEELVRESAPAIVFFDEVDSLLGKRDGSQVAEHHRATTNALLAWMDGFSVGDERIFFMAATNRPGSIDEAALRRFDEVVEVGTPSMEMRLQLVTKLIEAARSQGHLTDLDASELEFVSEQMDGMSLADVDRVVRKSFFQVLRELPTGVTSSITPADVPPVNIEHFKKILGGLQGTAQLHKQLQKRDASRAAT